MPMKINIKDKVNENVCDLSLGELEEIPTKEIAAFKRVTILDLSLNRLATLGTNFCILNRLVKLDLSKNRLRYLPDEFGLLQQLRYLDLFGNQLEHLPLSFGDLHNLRYLDLHNNPLNAALAKITGPCLTNRDCQESAKKTVNFMSLMQVEVLKVKKQYMDAMLSQNPSISNINGNDEKPCSSYSASFANAVEPQGIDSDSMVAAGANDAESHAKSTKKLNKKCKVKKKLQNEGKQQGPKILPPSATTTTATITGTTANNTFTKSSKSKRLTTNGGSNYQRQQKSLTNNSNKLNTNNSSSNSNSNNNKYKNYSSNNHGAALSSLITFILLLIVNIVLIYMIMFKNPQIAEKLVEAIPYQYRDWILSKTEIFRLRVTDWISQFRTPPDEH